MSRVSFKQPPKPPKRKSVDTSDDVVRTAILDYLAADAEQNFVPIIDQSGAFSGDYYDRREGPPPELEAQPEMARFQFHLDYLKNKYGYTPKAGEEIPLFDPNEPFKSEGIMSSIGNVLTAAYPQSLAGKGEVAANKFLGELLGMGYNKNADLGGLLRTPRQMQYWQPTKAEEIGTGIASFVEDIPALAGMELATYGIGTPALGARLGAAVRAIMTGQKAMKGLKTARTAARIARSATTFGQYEAAHGFLEGYNEGGIETGFRGALAGAGKGAVLGAGFGAAGAAAGAVGRRIPGAAGRRITKYGLSPGAEIVTLGGFQPLLEGRQPTADDFINAAGFIIGVKTAGSIAGIGKRVWNSAVKRKNAQLVEDARKSGDPRQYILTQTEQAIYDSPDRFGLNILEKAKTAKPRSVVGTLGDFIKHPTLAAHFAPIKDFKIRIVEDIPSSEPGLAHTGAVDFSGPRPEVILNQSYPDHFGMTLLHEMQHAMGIVKGREVGTEASETRAEKAATWAATAKISKTERARKAAETAALRRRGLEVSKAPDRIWKPEDLGPAATEGLKRISGQRQPGGYKFVTMESPKTLVGSTKAIYGAQREGLTIGMFEVGEKGKRRQVASVIDVSASTPERSVKLVEEALARAGKERLYYSRRVENSPVFKILRAAGLVPREKVGSFYQVRKGEPVTEVARRERAAKLKKRVRVASGTIAAPTEGKGGVVLSNKQVRTPFPQYIGAKKSMIEAGAYDGILPKDYKDVQLVEEFAGSGLVGDHLGVKSDKRVVNDYDRIVMNAHEQAANNPEQVITYVRNLGKRIEDIQEKFPDGGEEAHAEIAKFWKQLDDNMAGDDKALSAASFIVHWGPSRSGSQRIITGTGLSGGAKWLYRRGRMAEPIDAFREHGDVVKGAELRTEDARKTLADEKLTDGIHVLDPPYIDHDGSYKDAIERSKSERGPNGLYNVGVDLQYETEGLEFITKDMADANKRGVKMIYTNHWRDDIVSALQSLGFKTKQVMVRTQGKKGEGGGQRPEVIAWNYDETGSAKQRVGLGSGVGAGADVAGEVQGNVSGSEGRSGVGVAIPKEGPGGLAGGNAPSGGEAPRPGTERAIETLEEFNRKNKGTYSRFIKEQIKKLENGDDLAINEPPFRTIKIGKGTAKSEVVKDKRAGEISHILTEFNPTDKKNASILLATAYTDAFLNDTVLRISKDMESAVAEPLDRLVRLGYMTKHRDRDGLLFVHLTPKKVDPSTDTYMKPLPFRTVKVESSNESLRQGARDDIEHTKSTLRLDRREELLYAVRDIIGNTPHKAVVPELFQNSIDAGATRIMISTGVENGRATMWITDNGKGMTAQELHDHFFVVGAKGTKGADSAGGFGRAKAGILLWPDEISATTQKDGRLSRFSTTRDALLDSEIEVQSSSAKMEPGTSIKLVLPPASGGVYASASQAELADFIGSYAGKLRRKGLSVIVDGVERPPTVDKVIRTDVGEANGNEFTVQYIETQESPWPFMGKYAVKVEVYNHGLWMNTLWNDLNVSVPFKHNMAVRVNFTKTVPATSPYYPYIRNRRELLGSVQAGVRGVVKEYLDRLTEIHRDKALEDLRTALDHAPRKGGVRVILDGADEISSSSLRKALDEVPDDLFARIGKTYKEFNQALIDAGYTPGELAISVNPRTYGWTPSKWTGLDEVYAINPFAITGEGLIRGGVNDRSAAVATHTMVHEFAHKFSQSHDESFALSVADIYMKVGHRKLAALEESFEEIFSKHEGAYDNAKNTIANIFNEQSRNRPEAKALISMADKTLRVLPDEVAGRGVQNRQGEGRIGEGSKTAGGQGALAYRHLDVRSPSIVDRGMTFRTIKANDVNRAMKQVTPEMSDEPRVKRMIEGWKRAVVPRVFLRAKNLVETKDGKQGIAMLEEQAAREAVIGADCLIEADKLGLKKLTEKEANDQSFYAPRYRRLFDDLWEMLNAVNPNIGRVKADEKNPYGYVPRMLKDDVKEKFADDLRTLGKELEGRGMEFADLRDPKTPKEAMLALLGKLSDQAQKQMQVWVKEGKVGTIGEAMHLFRNTIRSEWIREPSFVKERKTDFLNEFYETDIRYILPRYIVGVSRYVSQNQVFGRHGDKWNDIIKKLQWSGTDDAKNLVKLMQLQTGEYELLHGLGQKTRSLIDAYIGAQVGAKIGLGFGTALNVSQTLYSTMSELGVWNTVRGFADVLDPIKRKAWLRASGAVEFMDERSMLALTGHNPGGAFGKFAEKMSKWSGFTGINRFNAYQAAATADRAVTAWYRSAQGSGTYAEWARKRLGDFGIDYRYPLGEADRAKAMYNFATKSQLQKSVLEDPLVFSMPWAKPFILFKRYGYRQAAYISEMLWREAWRGNFMPVVRLAAGGALGAGTMIWGMNKVRSILSGEPVYRKDDTMAQKVAHDLAYLGALGIISDALRIEKISDLPNAMLYMAKPVAWSDAEAIVKAFTDISKDYERYGDGWLATRRNMFQFTRPFGSVTTAVSKRFLSDPQKARRLKQQRGEERTELFRLILSGNGKAASDRIAQWNENHEREFQFGMHDVSSTELRKWVERQVRVYAEAYAEKGTKEYREAEALRRSELMKKLRSITVPKIDKQTRAQWHEYKALKGEARP